MAEYQHQPPLDSIENNLLALVDSTSALRRGFTTIASSLAETKLLLQEILNVLPPLPHDEQPSEQPAGLLVSPVIETIEIIVDADVAHMPNQPDSTADEALAGDFGLVQGEPFEFQSEQPTAMRSCTFSESVNVSIALVVQPKESYVDDMASQEQWPHALRSGSLISDTDNFGASGHFHTQRGLVISEHGFDPGGKQRGHLAAAQVFAKMPKRIDFVPPEISTLMAAEPVRANHALIPQSHQSSVFRWYEASSICSFATFEFTCSYPLRLPFSYFPVVDASLNSPYLPHASEFLGISKELQRLFMSSILRGVDALQTDSNGISATDTARQVSPFAEAGFLRRMSLSWLNPLMKLGSQNTLKEQDIPKLRVAERAESCYLQYLQQLNQQHHANPSSQPSLLTTVILCYWKANLNTGFFAFLTIVSLSTGPLILHSFILISAKYKWLFSLPLRKACNALLLTASPIMVSAATFGARYFLNVPLHANNVLTFVAILRLFPDPIRSIPNVISALLQAKVAFSRILNFLAAPELQCSNLRQQQNQRNEVENVLIVVPFKKARLVTIYWDIWCKTCKVSHCSLSCIPLLELDGGKLYKVGDLSEEFFAVDSASKFVSLQVGARFENTPDTLDAATTRPVSTLSTIKPFDPGEHFATTAISSRVVMDVGLVPSAIRSAFYLTAPLDAAQFYSHRALSSSLLLPQPCGQGCLEGEGNVMNILVEQPAKPKVAIEPFDPQGPKEKFSASCQIIEGNGMCSIYSIVCLGLGHEYCYACCSPLSHPYVLSVSHLLLLFYLPCNAYESH